MMPDIECVPNVGRRVVPEAPTSGGHRYTVEEGWSVMKRPDLAICMVPAVPTAGSADSDKFPHT